MGQPSLYAEKTCLILEKLWYKLRGINWIRTSELEQQLVDSYVLIMPKHGTGQLTIDYAHYRLRYGAVHFASPGQTIGLASEFPDGLEVYMIAFHIHADADHQEPFPLVGEVPIHSGTQGLVLCEIIYHCCRSEQAMERLRGQSGFQELMYWIVKNIQLQPETDPRLALDRTKDYIDEHYHENLTIDRLARMADISPKYYVDLFSKTYGLSAIEYITQVRINRAKHLMEHADLRLRDIAHQVGYSDEFYFSRKFKKEVGLSPSAYMKSRQRKIVAYSASVLGQLLALRMIPYAAPLHPKWTAYYYRMYRSEIPIHLSAYRFNQDWASNIELLNQAQPDIVICEEDHLIPDEKEQLERICSVYSVFCKDMKWREQFRTLAEFLGVLREAETWLAQYERKLASARVRLHRELQEKTLLVISIHQRNMYLYPSRGMNEVLFEDLQLHPVPAFASLPLRQLTCLEQIAEFNADLILLNICQEPESLNYWGVVQTAQLWRDLQAVRKHQVYSISSDPWREYSAYACARMVDDLLKQLTSDVEEA